MYYGEVKRIKRGFFGPKHKTVFTKKTPNLEALLAAMSRFDHDHHVHEVIDFTGSHGHPVEPPSHAPTHDEPAPEAEPRPTAWDLHGNPVRDERNSRNYGQRKMDQLAPEYAPGAQGSDIPF